MDEATLKFDDVVNALLSEQRRRTICGRGNDPVAAPSTASVQPSRSAKMRTKKKNVGKCTHCNKFGHQFENCFLRTQQIASKPGHKTSARPDKSAACTKEDTTDDDQDYQSMYSHSAFIAAVKKLHQSGNPMHSDAILHSTKRAKLVVKPEDDLRSLINGKRANRFSKPCTSRAHSNFRPHQGNSIDVDKKLKSIIIVPETSKFSPIEGCETVQPSHYEDEIDRTSAASIGSLSQLSLNFDEETNKTLEIYSNTCTQQKQRTNKFPGFIVDSGASIHMSHDKSLFTKLESVNRGRIKIANGTYIPILGYGQINLLVKTSTEPVSLTLDNVAYAPDLHVNLVMLNI